MDGRVKLLKEAKDPNELKGEVEVETQLVEDIHSVGKSGRFSWPSDFRPWEPGAAKGPSPLAYFISSMGLCHQSHYSEEASLMDLTLDSVKVKTKAVYDLRPGVGFEGITYETRIESRENEERIMELVERAEKACYVTSTLKRALKIEGKIYLNSNQVMSRNHSRR